MSRLAIVVVSYQTCDVLRECLTAIQRHSDPAQTEVIVVDNLSRDASVEMVRREFPSVVLLAQSVNGGFGVGNNIGVQAATAEHIMLLNSDAILLEDTGAALVRHLADHPDVVCVAPRIALPDGTEQPRVFGHQPTLWRMVMQSLSIGALLPGVRGLQGVDGRAGDARPRDVGWVSGVCMVMRRADFLAAGGFDPHIFMYCEDVDLCARLAAGGRKIVSLDRFSVRHYGGASSPAMPARLRNAVWQQRNLLKIVRRGSGRPAELLARLVIAGGLLLRLIAGLARVPSLGVQQNLLLRSSWLRLRDALGVPAAPAG